MQIHILLILFISHETNLMLLVWDERSGSLKYIFQLRCPQYLFLTDKDGNRIVSEANVVHFENLSEEFELLMKRYNCPYTLTGAKKMLASVNSTSAAEATSGGTVKKKFTVADLSIECVKLIQQVYAQDFQFFNYDVDPLRSVDLPRSAASNSTVEDDAVTHTDTNPKSRSPKSDPTSTAIASDLPTSSKKRPNSEVDSWLH